MKYYYKFPVNSPLGNRLSAFWNACQRADIKAEAYAKKMGAVSFYSNPFAFAGGVSLLSFPKRKMADGTEQLVVNREQWRSEGFVGGEECFVPNTTAVIGCTVYPDTHFRPSDTASIVYHKRFSSWSEVRHVYSVKKWREKAMIKSGATLTNEEMKKKLDEEMKDKCFLLYTEYKGLTSDKLAAKRAVRAEVFRMALPIVLVSDFYRIFGVEDIDFRESEETPTFFVYGDFYCVSMSAKKAPSYDTVVSEIPEQQFIYNRNVATGKRYEA